MDTNPEYNNRFMDYLLYRSLKGEGTAEEEAKVLEWRRFSSENEAYYRQLERLLALTADAYREPQGAVGALPSASELVRLAQGSEPTSRPRDPTTRVRRRRLDLWLVGGLGAIAAAILLLLAPVGLRTGSNELLSFGVDEFVTGSNDVATVQLRDGSVVHLAPRSRLRLTGPPGEREVRLDGRAYFAVAHVKDSPFTVRTAGGDAVVLGTRFEAESHGSELRLLVVEGRVALTVPGTTAELGAGEMARAVEGAVSAAVKVPDPQSFLDWTGNFLVFQRTPVERVAAEIRSHFGLPVKVVGSDLEAQTVTAWFSDAVAEDVIRVVCRVLAARCSIEDGEAIIDLAPASGTGRRAVP